MFTGKMVLTIKVLTVINVIRFEIIKTIELKICPFICLTF